MRTQKHYSIPQHIIRTLRKWLRPPRSLRVTKAGWKFLGLTLIVGFAAINTGNNLLYLVFGLMLSAITASGILSELMLRKVRIVRTFPRHLFAHQESLVSVTISNRKRYLSSFSLVIEDFSLNTPTSHSRYVLKVPAGGQKHVSYPMTFTRRGRHRPGKMKLSTRYPFGFFNKSATFIETDEDILVYPAIEKLQNSELFQASRHGREVESRRKGQGVEIHGLREYVQGDATTHIHWKSTAKLAKLMTKEFEDESDKKITLLLDVALPGRFPPAGFQQDVERAISLTASYVVHLIQRNFQIQLITPASGSIFDYGQRHLFRLLRMLALLEPVNGQSRRRITKSLRALKRAEMMNILISVNQVKGERASPFSRVIQVRSQERVGQNTT